MATAGYWLAILAAAYLAICALAYLFQERLLFLPDIPGRRIAATPAALSVTFEELAITTDDGVRLHGWWIPAEGARFTLLHFHGNAGNIGDRLEMLRLWRELGVNVLLFDYRGYGRSEGTPREPGLYRDAEAVWRHVTLERGVPPARVVLHGQSLGAAVAAWLAARTQPAGLVLESGFTSVPDMAAEAYPWLPGRWMTHLRLDTRGEVARARCPVLVIHSTGDEIVPYAHGQALYAAAPEPRRLVTIEGDHNSGYWVSREAYVAGLRDFLATLPAPG